MTNSPKSQTARILKWLQKGRSITALDALKKFSTLRLSGRIKEIRDDGYLIKTEMIEIGNKRVARYSMGGS